MTELESGLITSIFYWNIPLHENTSGIWGGHVSMRTNRLGVVYISEDCCEYHGTLPSELFALHLDGSNTIERYGKHHSNRDLNDNGNLNDDSNAYRHQAKPVVNRDGTKIVFNSNWHRPEWQHNNSAYAFILEVPQETLSIDEYNVTEKPYLTEYFTILGQYLGTEKPKKQGIYIEKKYFEHKILSELIPIK